MLARTRARLTTKIESKISLYPHSHFTEHLVGAFGKPPQESDLNHESSSLLIQWLKHYTGISLQWFTQNTSTNRNHRRENWSLGEADCTWLLCLRWPRRTPLGQRQQLSRSESAGCSRTEESEQRDLGAGLNTTSRKPWATSALAETEKCSTDEEQRPPV
jgi:hypothetical protein